MPAQCPRHRESVAGLQRAERERVRVGRVRGEDDLTARPREPGRVAPHLPDLVVADHRAVGGVEVRRGAWRELRLARVVGRLEQRASGDRVLGDLAEHRPYALVHARHRKRLAGASDRRRDVLHRMGEELVGLVLGDREVVSPSEHRLLEPAVFREDVHGPSTRQAEVPVHRRDRVVTARHARDGLEPGELVVRQGDVHRQRRRLDPRSQDKDALRDPPVDDPSEREALRHARRRLHVWLRFVLALLLRRRDPGGPGGIPPGGRRTHDRRFGQVGIPTAPHRQGGCLHFRELRWFREEHLRPGVGAVPIQPCRQRPRAGKVGDPFLCLRMMPHPVPKELPVVAS